jgi:oligopeptide transport system substrate-binding protein
VRERSTIAKLVAVLMALALLAAACGGDDDDSDEAAGGGQTEGQEGGELTDLGTFIDGPPEHIDPALNTLLDNYQVINLLYDGLTDFDYSDPDNPELKGVVAESFESNADASEWTFTIRDDVTFSDGEPVLPSSFQRAWERASDPDFAGDYSYLFNFIDGGAEKLDGSAPTISGVTVDDEARTLTVKLDAPYANFAAVAGFQIFYPMPSAVDDLEDQSDWENGLMIGNGPYKLADPRDDQHIVVERNEEWAGDFENDRAKLDRIDFVISQDVESAYNAFEAGDGDTASLVPGRVAEADENYGTTLDTPYLGSYYYEIKWTDPTIGGPENKLIRQALSQAIDRDAINEAVYDGTRTNATGVTPEGIPGFESDLCDYCAYDKEAAQDAFDQWKSEGNSLDEPIKIQLNPGAGHEDVVQIIIDNWREIGIEATADPLDPETYFSQLADGACNPVCRSGWIADYPTYDNFTYDLFSSDAIGGNNHSEYSNPEFDRLVGEAKANTDEDEAADQYHQAEQILLNDDIGVIPINFYKGDYVYNPDRVQNFHQTPLGIVQYDQVTVTD